MEGPHGFLLVLKVFLGILRIVGSKDLCLVGGSLLDEPCRHAAPYLVVADLCATEHEGSGSYYGTLADVGTIEYRGSHAYETALTERTGMDGSVVAYGNVVLHDGGTRGVGDVDAGAVLHVATVAHRYGSYVATHDGTEPYGTFVAHCYFADYGGCLAEIAVLTPFG